MYNACFWDESFCPYYVSDVTIFRPFIFFLQFQAIYPKTVVSQKKQSDRISFILFIADEAKGV